ncbi:hypothetical protein N7510_002838 [Penicillium lagena]|uniref:uncharacterized protein n=1 Tax=Penicillium lagena TaxID=94218 RepID=UPI0025424B78|nr:uncharacterized protein N7510_002838 [Penicillium lagena]KAJ5618854.1 hypothetical protein N7510_002838 [Penicillium lagena]
MAPGRLGSQTTTIIGRRRPDENHLVLARKSLQTYLSIERRSDKTTTFSRPSPITAEPHLDRCPMSQHLPDSAPACRQLLHPRATAAPRSERPNAKTDRRHRGRHLTGPRRNVTGLLGPISSLEFSFSLSYPVPWVPTWNLNNRVARHGISVQENSKR